MYIVEKEPKSQVSETYRMLRTNIQYSGFDKKIKTLLVTSAAPGEGKSTTVGNLGIAFGQDDKKVLIIDCDLRRPSVHKNFLISNNKGLSEYISGQAPLDECVKKYNDNVHLLPSGKIPPNPSEMLASQTMQSFLEEMSNVYDVVIIDSPPVMAVTDAQILATYTDGVVLVIGSGQAEKDEIIKAKSKLNQVSAHILGVVLTKMPMDKQIHRSKIYNGYYGIEEKASRPSRRRNKNNKSDKEISC